ncbi:tyrosine-type recombinase/integrase [Arthrobacter sp. MDT1-65]
MLARPSAPRQSSWPRRCYATHQLKESSQHQCSSLWGYPFLGDHGLLPHQNTIGYWWRKTLTNARHSGMRLHDLRHFYASGLIASGCDVVTVQRALGHSKATTTLNTYSHLWLTAEDRTRTAAGSMMAEA